MAVARAAVEQPAAAPVARTAAVLAVREAARRGALPEALEVAATAVPRAASLALEVEADSSVPNRVGRWSVAGRFVQY